jgi:hypothetical protein
MQFQLDRPVFKSVEEKKSVIEKIRREVLVELHMSSDVWKAIGQFMEIRYCNRKNARLEIASGGL